MELELDAMVLFRFALEETGEGIGLGIILGMGGTAETVADIGTLLTGAAFFPFKMDCVYNNKSRTGMVFFRPWHHSHTGTGDGNF